MAAALKTYERAATEILQGFVTAIEATRPPPVIYHYTNDDRTAAQTLFPLAAAVQSADDGRGYSLGFEAAALEDALTAVKSVSLRAELSARTNDVLNPRRYGSRPARARKGKLIPQHSTFPVSYDDVSPVTERRRYGNWRRRCMRPLRLCARSSDALPVRGSVNFVGVCDLMLPIGQ
jgi:hypothetical protein